MFPWLQDGTQEDGDGAGRAREIVWQSPDGMMEVGLIAGFPRGHVSRRLQYSCLGSRLLTLSDIEGLTAALQLQEAQEDPLPLLLVADCPGFEAVSDADGQALALAAGRLRNRLQARKQAGGKIWSYIHTVSVGGVYLMHGLAAQRRAGDPATRFHDTVLSQPPVAMSQVLARGLVDALVPVEDAESWFRAELHGD